MPAYVLSELEVLDETAAAEYRRLAAASIQEHGGRYLARSVKPEVIEGEPSWRLVVLIEFANLERAHEWYRSPSCARALVYRRDALERRLMIFDGVMP